MDIRSTRCVSDVFGFLKEYECQICGESKLILEDNCNVQTPPLVKKSVSDTKLTESNKKSSRSANTCTCQLAQEFDKMEGGCGETTGDTKGQTTVVPNGETTEKHKGKAANENLIPGDSELKGVSRNEANSDKYLGKFEQVSKEDDKIKEQNKNGNNLLANTTRQVGGSIEAALKINGHTDTEAEQGNLRENHSTKELDEDVVLRSRNQIPKTTRTNTTVISEVFNFLKTDTDKLSEIMEDGEELDKGASNPKKSPVMTGTTEQVETNAVENGTAVKESQQGGGEGVGGAKVVMRRSQRLISKQTLNGDSLEESSDEDAGIYDESVRRSKWIRVEEDGQLLVVGSSDADSLDRKTSGSGSGSDRHASHESTSEDVFVRSDGLSPRTMKAHQRSDSCSTTLSEREFKRQFSSTKKCIIQRNDSQQEYHRYSCKVYDQEKVITIQKLDTDTDFGLHLLDCQPAYITSVDPGSPAERAGIIEGQIVVSVNGVNVLESTHEELLQLIQQKPSVVTLEVAFSDYQPVRNFQSAVCKGYMYKLGSSTIVKKWNKRYFVLRQDNCLYYYKTDKDVDPLGAIPLSGYSILRYLDTNKDFCYKAEKYGARTYYFMTDGREEMTNWVGKLTEAAARSKKRKDSWLEVSSHNVGLPALEIRRPECTGYLIKCAPRYKTWKKRYCVLKDACIYYYKNMSSLSAQGVAHLHGYTVNPSCSSSKRHSFALIPPEESMRIFYFHAENETDKDRWVDSLIRSIQRWKKAD